MIKVGSAAQMYYDSFKKYNLTFKFIFLTILICGLTIVGLFLGNVSITLFLMQNIFIKIIVILQDLHLHTDKTLNQLLFINNIIQLIIF